MTFIFDRLKGSLLLETWIRKSTHAQKAGNLTTMADAFKMLRFHFVYHAWTTHTMGLFPSSKEHVIIMGMDAITKPNFEAPHKWRWHRYQTKFSLLTLALKNNDTDNSPFSLSHLE